jgi:hypothetical protein
VEPAAADRRFEQQREQEPAGQERGHDQEGAEGERGSLRAVAADVGDEPGDPGRPARERDEQARAKGQVRRRQGGDTLLHDVRGGEEQR